MSGQGTVWSGTDLEVVIFLEDDDGNAVNLSDQNKYDPATDTPVLSYCYWQGVDIRADLEAARRPSTGRAKKEIVVDEFIYTCSIQYFYFLKEEFDKTNIFNREKRMTVFARFFNPCAGIDEPHWNEQHILRHSVGKLFGVSTQENDISNGSATFWAEDYYNNT